MVDDMLDGLICQQCGVFVDGESPGHPRTCDGCDSEEKDQEVPSGTGSCDEER